MRRTSHLFAALAASLLSLPAAAAAQQPTPAPKAHLQVGQWTGTVTTPDGNTTDVTYDVSESHDTTSLTLNAAEHGSFKVSDLKFDGMTLTFSFTPGPQVACTLKKQDNNSMTGQCIAEDGSAAQMVMNPPKKG